MQSSWKFVFVIIPLLLLNQGFVSADKYRCARLSANPCVDVHGYVKVKQIGWWRDYYYVFTEDEKRVYFPPQAYDIVKTAVELDLYLYIDSKEEDFSVAGAKYTPRLFEWYKVKYENATF